VVKAYASVRRAVEDGLADTLDFLQRLVRTPSLLGNEEEAQHLVEERSGQEPAAEHRARPDRRGEGKRHEVARRPATAPAPEEGDDLSIKRASRRTEESLIRRALAKTGGNRTRAAELLEISHRALLYKIKDNRLDEAS